MAARLLVTPSATAPNELSDAVQPWRSGAPNAKIKKMMNAAGLNLLMSLSLAPSAQCSVRMTSKMATTVAKWRAPSERGHAPFVLLIAELGDDFSDRLVLIAFVFPEEEGKERKTSNFLFCGTVHTLPR
jgi:hypothetical protein